MIDRWAGTLLGTLFVVVGTYRLFLDGPTAAILVWLVAFGALSAVGWKRALA